MIFLNSLVVLIILLVFLGVSLFFRGIQSDARLPLMGIWGLWLTGLFLTTQVWSPNLFSWLPYPLLTGAALASLALALVVTLECWRRWLFKANRLPASPGMVFLLPLVGGGVGIRPASSEWLIVWIQLAFLGVSLFAMMLSLLDLMRDFWVRRRKRRAEQTEESL